MSDTREKIFSSYVNFYEGYEEKSLAVDQIFSDQSSGLWRPETNTFIDFMTMKSLYYSEDWVFILVDRIASKISSQYLRVMRDDVVGGKKIAKPAEGHPVQKILDQPNEVQDYHTFMYSLVADDCILGNSFLWFSKSLGQIIPIPGENIRPFFDSRGNLTKYLVTYGSDEQGIKPVSWTLTLDEICHVRRPNPSSMFIGLSPFIPAQKSLLFSRYSAEYLNNYYIKGAQPGIVLEMSQEANQEMALRLLRSMESAYTGRRNQRRNMVLPRGVKATQLSTTIADQQLIDLVNQNREKIINILQVPKHELSIAEAGSLGSEEYKVAIRNFWRGPLRSTMRRIAGALTVKFKDQLGDGYYLEFDLSDIEYLSEDESIKAETATKMLTTHTVNEVRAKVYDLPPLPGGDNVPGTMPAFPQISLPQQEVAPKTELPNEAQSSDYDTKRFQRVESFIKANGGDWWSQREAEKAKELERAQGDVGLLALAYLEDVANAASKLVTQKSKATDDAELRKKLKKALAELEDDYVAGFVDALSATVEMGYSTALKLPFEMPNSDAINVLRARNANRRLSLLEARGLKSFAEIGRPTTETVIKIVADGLEEGSTLKQISELIKEELTGQKAASRAMTIARTESLTATSIGQAAAMKDASRATGENIKKMWITAQDDRVRGLDDKDDYSHADIHGQIKDYDEPFYDERSGTKIQFPREPGHPAGMVINCFPPDTFVDGIDVEKVFSRVYSGPMITIYFKGGDKLSGTPNHPILTPEGWVALGSLAKGGKVFKASGFDCSGVVDRNIKNIKATFAELLGSFSDPSDAVSISGAVVDFHGDGSTKDVNVIDAKRGLQNRIESSGFKKSKDLGFSDAHLAHSFGFSGSGDLEPSGWIRSSHGGVSPSDLLPSSVNVESTPLNGLGLASISLLEPVFVESFNNGFSGEANNPTNLQNGELLFEVHIDEIINVDVTDYSGQVCNLQTKGGYYIANKVIAHNCRCDWVMVPESQKDIMNEWKTELESEA